MRWCRSAFVKSPRQYHDARRLVVDARGRRSPRPGRRRRRLEEFGRIGVRVDAVGIVAGDLGEVPGALRLAGLTPAVGEFGRARIVVGRRALECAGDRPVHVAQAFGRGVPVDDLARQFVTELKAVESARVGPQDVRVASRADRRRHGGASAPLSR